MSDAAVGLRPLRRPGLSRVARPAELRRRGLAAAQKKQGRAAREGAVAATGSPREVVAADPIREVYGVELVEGGALGFRLSED